MNYEKTSKPKVTKMPKNNHKGRPASLYHSIFAKQVKQLCLLGMIDNEIAKFFDISVRTLNRWKHKYPDFWQSMKAGKTIADSKIAHSLYQSALGGHYIEEERPIIDSDGNIKIIKLRKQVPPNVTAQKYWLNNRQPEKWSNHNKSSKKESVTKPSFDHLKNLSAVMKKSRERQNQLRIERGLELGY